MCAAHLGHADVLVWPLGRTNLENLPLWMKQFPHIGNTISPCGVVSLKIVMDTFLLKSFNPQNEKCEEIRALKAVGTSAWSY